MPSPQSACGAVIGGIGVNPSSSSAGESACRSKFPDATGSLAENLGFATMLCVSKLSVVACDGGPRQSGFVRVPSAERMVPSPEL
eukprot:SAG25_NODE_9837_length_356_cov_0.603113_1_plen_84_part_10